MKLIVPSAKANWIKSYSSFDLSVLEYLKPLATHSSDQDHNHRWSGLTMAIGIIDAQWAFLTPAIIQRTEL